MYKAYQRIFHRVSSVLENTWWGYPLLILLVGLLTYGYIIPQLGYYWDDWEVVYLTQLASWQDLLAYTAPNRPFSWPNLLYGAMFGASPVGWHLITILLRCAAVVLLYQTLLNLWPARKFEL